MMIHCKLPKDLLFLCKALSSWTTERELNDLKEAAVNRRVCWETVASYANRANLAPALRQAMVSRNLWSDAPAALREYLDEIYCFNSIRNEQLKQQLCEAIGFLNGAGITPMPIKGASSLAGDIFPDPAIRFMWDLDILVPEEKMELAVSVLKDGGYVVPGKYQDGQSAFAALPAGNHHYAPLIKPGAAATVELHGRALFDRGGALLETAAIWQEGRRFTSNQLPGVSLLLMSPTHQIIHCFAHSELSHEHRLEIGNGQLRLGHGAHRRTTVLLLDLCVRFRGKRVRGKRPVLRHDSSKRGIRCRGMA